MLFKEKFVNLRQIDLRPGLTFLDCFPILDHVIIGYPRELFLSDVVISTCTLFIHNHMYKSHIDMCRTKGYRLLHCFGFKTAHFSLESGKVFIGTTGVYEIRFVGVLIQVMVT